MGENMFVILLALFIAAIFGYLIGSIQNALIIGKFFYKTDVRTQGSGNLGATNVARTLGAKPGIIVLVLDMLKSIFASNGMYLVGLYLFKFDSTFWLAMLFITAGFMTCIGHCFPLFAHFKGGKAVSVIAGFAIGSNYIVTLVGLFIFALTFAIKKIVSLSSICMALFTSVLSFIPFFYEGFYLYPKEHGLYYSITLLVISILLIIRHQKNIIKLWKGEEKPFQFAKKKIKE